MSKRKFPEFVEGQKIEFLDLIDIDMFQYEIEDDFEEAEKQSKKMKLDLDTTNKTLDETKSELENTKKTLESTKISFAKRERVFEDTIDDLHYEAKIAEYKITFIRELMVLNVDESLSAVNLHDLVHRITDCNDEVMLKKSLFNLRSQTLIDAYNSISRIFILE